jgi:hypothetical protein
VKRFIESQDRALAGAAEVGVTAVVDDNEQDVRLACWHPVLSGTRSPGMRRCSYQGLPKTGIDDSHKLAAPNLDLANAGNPK